MRIVDFFVPGDPVGRDTGQTASGRHYTTAAGKMWRHKIAAYALACPDHPTGEPHLGAVTLTLIFMLPRPPSHYLVGGNLSAAGKRFPRPTGKPDCSNLLKPLEDVFSAGTKTSHGLAWWRDDAQIVTALVEKRWCSPGQEPGVYVTLRFEDSPPECPHAAKCRP